MVSGHWLCAEMRSELEMVSLFSCYPVTPKCSGKENPERKNPMKQTEDKNKIKKKKYSKLYPTVSVHGKLYRTAKIYIISCNHTID